MCMCVCVCLGYGKGGDMHTHLEFINLKYVHIYVIKQPTCIYSPPRLVQFVQYINQALTHLIFLKDPEFQVS